MKSDVTQLAKRLSGITTKTMCMVMGTLMSGHASTVLTPCGQHEGGLPAQR